MSQNGTKHMEEKELLDFTESFSDSGTKKVFIFLIKYLTTIKQDVAGVKEDVSVVKDEVKKLKETTHTVTIINGGGEGVETTFQRNQFYQLIYDRIARMEREKVNKGGFKNTVKSLAWWSDNIMKILVAVAIVLGIIGFNYLNNLIQNTPK